MTETDPRVAIIRRALKQSFADTVAASADMLFEDTGVTMPADTVWDRYAVAALQALDAEARK